jgi:hypothetical protein
VPFDSVTAMLPASRAQKAAAAATNLMAAVTAAS